MSKRKWIFITTVMMTMLLGIAGCGKNTEDGDGAGTSGVIAEDLPEAENGTDEETSGAEDEKTSGAEDVDMAGTDLAGDALPASAEKAAKPHYINEGKDLYGDIWEVEEGRFKVTEIYHEETEDGGEVSVGVSEEAAGEEPKITVVYDENTTFVKQKIWDGGANHEEKEGTAEDLEKGLSAQMKGSYEGDVFHATEILIVEVVWD